MSEPHAPRPPAGDRWGDNWTTAWLRGNVEIPMSLDGQPVFLRAATLEKSAEVDVHAALNGRADLIPDNVHPNARGARLIAAAVYRAVTGSAPPADSAKSPIGFE